MCLTRFSTGDIVACRDICELMSACSVAEASLSNHPWVIGTSHCVKVVVGRARETTFFGAVGTGRGYVNTFTIIGVVLEELTSFSLLTEMEASFRSFFSRIAHA